MDNVVSSVAKIKILEMFFIWSFLVTVFNKSQEYNAKVYSVKACGTFNRDHTRKFSLVEDWS